MTTENWIAIAIAIATTIAGIGAFLGALLGPALAVLVEKRISQPKPTPNQTQATVVQKLVAWVIRRFSSFRFLLLWTLGNILICSVIPIWQLITNEPLTRWSVFISIYWVALALMHYINFMTFPSPDVYTESMLDVHTDGLKNIHEHIDKIFEILKEHAENIHTQTKSDLMMLDLVKVLSDEIGHLHDALSQKSLAEPPPQTIIDKMISTIRQLLTGQDSN